MRVLFAAMFLSLAGCTTVKQSFVDVPADTVWTAMVAVAREPRYDDWTVAANDVWVDPAKRRIEVYRRVHRVLFRPAAEPWPQSRAWRFRISLEGDAAPQGVFVSRGWGVPAHAQHEASRYFQDVLRVLGGAETLRGP